MNALRCTQGECLSIREPGSPYCAQHRLLDRRRRGVCPNCGAEREVVPVLNDLTGRQLRRGPRREPVWQHRCTGCGHTQRPWTEGEVRPHDQGVVR